MAHNHNLQCYLNITSGAKQSRQDLKNLNILKEDTYQPGEGVLRHVGIYIKKQIRKMQSHSSVKYCMAWLHSGCIGPGAMKE